MTFHRNRRLGLTVIAKDYAEPLENATTDHQREQKQARGSQKEVASYRFPLQALAAASCRLILHRVDGNIDIHIVILAHGLIAYTALYPYWTHCHRHLTLLPKLPEDVSVQYQSRLRSFSLWPI